MEYATGRRCATAERYRALSVLLPLQAERLAARGDAHALKGRLHDAEVAWREAQYTRAMAELACELVTPAYAAD